MIGRVVFLALCAATMGCATDKPHLGTEAGVETAALWRSVATQDDQRRLRGWRDAWITALDQARANGHGNEIAAEGVLLDPDGALPFSDIPQGIYRCRTVKIGSQAHGALAYIAYPFFRCRIAQGENGLRFSKLSGSQRPIGILYADGGSRRVFLGTLQLGDEQRAFRYGDDRERDMAGVLERIGDNRWRLALPYPHFESMMDVIELLPGE
ncbi:DUF4893 domain-containing protein [Allosphingosinicella flava]|uniref:DUF4893 domain-containing protein n=1 Tax=Allosphingosinicella flava TaxID=2771430 RepID=A0A7T2GJ24_9SPHN|nr:DUF4893 domain-containing protein [Sphingosinicella flava]QPQ54796.1 DUF4893 domain-containing protein [Sphingosinicella flava]